MVNVADFLDTAYGQLASKQHCALTEIKTVTLHCLSQAKALLNHVAVWTNHISEKLPWRLQVKLCCVDPVGNTASSSFNII